MAALAVLVAVNAALIALLLRSQSQVTAEPASFGSSVPTQLPASSPASESTSIPPTPSPPPTPPTEQKVALPTRLLVATSATSAWRATVGDCQTQGRVERSTDGGRSWRQAVEPALGPIVRLGVQSNEDLYTVGGAGADCSIRYISYSTDGAITAQTDAPRGIWTRDPKDPNQIKGPGSARATPCKGRHVLGLAPLSRSEALIVCTDGSVIVTSDSGRTWDGEGELAGTMAVGVGDGRFWVAGRGKDCDGIAIRSISLTAGKLSRGRIRCAADLSIDPGRTAIDVSGKAIWLWAGNKVQVSTDRGQTWKAG